MTAMTEKDYQDAAAANLQFDKDLARLRKFEEYDQIAERVFRKILIKIVAPALVGWWLYQTFF